VPHPVQQAPIAPTPQGWSRNAPPPPAPGLPAPKDKDKDKDKTKKDDHRPPGN
jgi:hypothetical protein